MTSNHDAFPPEVIARLKTYVYRLIDPRTGVTFYVGKGTGNRVFEHVRAEQSLEGDPNSNKLRQIREIHRAGFSVSHVIHRHGLDHATAFHVEGALIDAYPGLTNIAGGVDNTDIGVMHASEIIERHTAPTAIFDHKALVISVSRTAADRVSLYEATRYAWKLDPARAGQAEVILSSVRGLIVGAFVAERWMEATAANFPGLSEDIPGRFGFEGVDAPEEVQREYLRHRIPDSFRKRGASNPIRYSW